MACFEAQRLLSFCFKNENRLIYEAVNFVERSSNKVNNPVRTAVTIILNISNVVFMLLLMLVDFPDNFVGCTCPSDIRNHLYSSNTPPEPP